VPSAFAAAALIVGIQRIGGAAAFVSTSVGALFAALIAIYLFTPYDFAWHLGTSTSRVVLPLGLLLATFVPIVLSRGRPQRPGGIP
jgi:hypothetical protein